MVETFRIDRNALGDLWPALELIRSVCREVRVAYFVIGAAARDLLLEHVYGVRPLRATRDVDIAVTVPGWDEYEAVLDHLVKAHGFERAKEDHRVRRAGLIIDVIPFGEIARGDQVAWPMGTTAMSVLGYQEAYEAAVGIMADDGPALPVASLPGVGVLKLLAWKEAPHRRRQDPADLCAIMTAYHEVVGERLFDDHADLLEDDDFDYQVASARIYGRDVAPLLRTSKLRNRILAVLKENTEDDDSALALAMGSACHHEYAFRLRCLRAFLQGIRDRVQDDP